jgi:hypothetical protein
MDPNNFKFTVVEKTRNVRIWLLLATTAFAVLALSNSANASLPASPLPAVQPQQQQSQEQPFDCSQIEAKGIYKQLSFRAAQIMQACGRAGSSPTNDEKSSPSTGASQLRSSLLPGGAKASGGNSAAPYAYGGTDVWVHPPITDNIQSTSFSWRNGNTVLVTYLDLAAGSVGKGSYSTDGGATFARLPGDPFATGHGSAIDSPTVVYDALHGKWIATFLVNGCGGLGIGAWTSSDGISWTAAGCVHNNNLDDRSFTWQDNYPSSPFYGRTYVAYNNFNIGGGALQTTFSTDGGSTWAAPVTASAWFTRDVGLTVLPSGRVVLAGMGENGGGGNPQANYFFLSDNGGVTWSRLQQGSLYPAPGNTVCGSRPYFRVITPQIMYMGWGQPAGGPNNVVHYAYTAHGPGSDEGDIYYVRSTDGGNTWSTPLLLNTDGSGRAQWMPSVAVTEQGAVFVSWYDRRDTTNNDYWRYGRASLDNGATWQADMAVSDAVIPQPAVSPATCYGGRYDFWQADGKSVQGGWTDSRSPGNNGTQDVFYDNIELVPPSPTPTRTPLPDYPIVINELDADQTSIDTGEFVELYDGGVGNSSLTGLVVVFYSGANDLSYAAFDLDGYTTDAAGYFTLGNAAVPGVDLVFPGNTLQNGPDAVAFYSGDASQFPNGTPITTTNLLDAVVYDTSDPDDPELLMLLNSGQPQVDENALGTGTTVSIGRCPNGSGGSHNTYTYTQTNPSADGPNACSPVTPTPTQTAVATATATETAPPTSTSTDTPTFTPTPTNTATPTSTSTPAGSPNFSITVTPATATVARPGSVQYNVTLTSLNGFSGNVSLSVSGLPAQTTGSFNPPVVTLSSGGTGSSVLTITANKGGPRGTFTLTITGTSGAIVRSQNVTLVISR